MNEANSMDNNTPKKGVLCMKWDSDGELSTHDTDALIKRLAKAENLVVTCLITMNEEDGDHA